MSKHDKLNKVIGQLHDELKGTKGKRQAKNIVSNRLDNAGLKHAINVNDNYHCFYVEVNENNGGSKDLFIDYTSNGIVKRIHG